MNLKEVYEIFYPDKNKQDTYVWKDMPAYRSKKDFFIAFVPMELQWINAKIWNDKARRSRFFSDSKKESKYVTSLRLYLLEHPWTILRIEKKADDLLCGKISENSMNDIFFRIVKQEQIDFSEGLWEYLVEPKNNRLRDNWGNVLTFYFLLAIFPDEINQIYSQYLYQQKERNSFNEYEDNSTITKKDWALFQYEFPPDMGVFYPEEMIHHTWVIKNAGEMEWRGRYYECVSSLLFDLEEENRVIHIPNIVYPGDVIFPSVHFKAPKKPGIYSINWKMKDQCGNIAYLDKIGLGLHFTVLESELEHEEDICKNNYKVLEEIPVIPTTIGVGKLYSHVWLIQNVGEEIWKDYYLECINAESFCYAKSELRVMMKQHIVPGEKSFVRVEFVTPPIEGVFRLIWKFMKKDGTPAFPTERKLEILLNVI